MDSDQNLVLGKLNGLDQHLLNVVAIAPSPRDGGLVTVVLMVVESHRDLAWKVDHTYGSGSNQLAALAATAKNPQSKK